MSEEKLEKAIRDRMQSRPKEEEPKPWYLIKQNDTASGAEEKLTFDSLGELFLSLQEKSFVWCYAIRQDGEKRFPASGSAPEGRLKGMIGWEILNVRDYE